MCAELRPGPTGKLTTLPEPGNWIKGKECGREEGKGWENKGRK